MVVVTSAQTLVSGTDSIASIDISNYTRDQLMACRMFVLATKRTARQGGFGEVAGRIMRDTLGYKFDSAPVDTVLAAMEAPDFLPAYSAKLDAWYEGLNKSASTQTLKGNANKYSAAKALASDERAFAKLVRALRVLCVRNQSWMESGNHVAIPMNGHRALLDLFCINVTNNRRLSLAAA